METNLEETLAQMLCLALERPVAKEQVKLFSDVGNNKLIYSVPTPDGEYLAVAVPRDLPEGSEEYDLLNEYRLLKLFYSEAEEFFPKPGIYIESETHRIFTMELLPQRRIREVKPELIEEEQRELVWQIGYVMGVTYGRTGYFTEEPHDDNILCEHDGEPIVKLIDTAHFIEGDLEQLKEATYREQDLCDVYQEEFEEGLENGLNEA